jgi:hypothetical protein
VNVAPNSDGVVVEGVAPKVYFVEEIPTAESKHHTHFYTYLDGELILNVA